MSNIGTRKHNAQNIDFSTYTLSLAQYKHLCGAFLCSTRMSLVPESSYCFLSVAEFKYTQKHTHTTYVYLPSGAFPKEILTE